MLCTFLIHITAYSPGSHCPLFNIGEGIQVYTYLTHIGGKNVTIGKDLGVSNGPAMDMDMDFIFHRQCHFISRRNFYCHLPPQHCAAKNQNSIGCNCTVDHFMGTPM